MKYWANLLEISINEYFKFLTVKKDFVKSYILENEDCYFYIKVEKWKRKKREEIEKENREKEERQENKERERKE